ncbi:MAG: hypothetical protein ACTSRG_02525 [Candidatus Helarchaeota archaeon]
MPEEYPLHKILLSISVWFFLGFIGWFGLLFVGPLNFNTRDSAIGFPLIVLGIATLGLSGIVEKYKDDPEICSRYFWQWLAVCIIFIGICILFYIYPIPNT